MIESTSGDTSPVCRIPGAGEDGFALLFVLLMAIVVAALAAGATMMQTNSTLISRWRAQSSVLETVADAGLEEARSIINRSNVFPDDGYVTLEEDAEVLDADDEAIPNVTRTIWVGPTGVTTGQYGVFGSIVVEARDSRGNRIVRRQEIRQESFSKFAYFTDVEPSSIAFGGGDQILGPVHSNDHIKIYSSGATFRSHVTTAKTVQGDQYATFDDGYTEHAPEIEMPATAEFSRLKKLAKDGNTYFPGNSSGSTGQATTRIEFVAIDLDGDGEATGDSEGFIRVYKSNDASWVVADMPGSNLRNSENCGHYHGSTFVPAADHSAWGSDDWKNAVSGSGRRCYLGGADALSNGFDANDGGKGQWRPWDGPSFTLPVGRADAGYLIPINRTYNPDFKGVIYVEGNVAISGVVRGNVTFAAKGDIVIADDITYATDPGAGTCADVLGLFAKDDVIVSDNTLNAPQAGTGSSWYYYTYDDTKDEFIHAIVLALGEFTVDNYAGGSTSEESCEGTSWGRGCLYLTGGIIQNSRGAVGTSGGTGYIKRYSYDSCAATNPPPYYPTTGHFSSGIYYEIDPTNFDIDSLFETLTPSS